MDFINDELVLFKDYTMLELKTMFHSLPTGPSGGGDLPYGYGSIKKAIELHRHYISVKLNNAPKYNKRKISIAEYQKLDESTQSKYSRFCGSDEVHYELLP